MKQVLIKIIGVCICTFFFFSFTNSFASAVEVTDDFPIDEKRYNIDHMKARSSLSALEGKLIKSNDGKVVRLVEANHNGKVLVNDGIVPEAVTVYDSIEEATEVKLKAAGQVCNDVDYIKFLKKKGVPSSVVIKNKTYKLNAALTRQYEVIVYGKPSNISNNSYKNKQYEFLGYGKNGGWIMNHKYPVKELSESGPDISRFLTVGSFTGPAEDAGKINNVYAGQDDYSNAKKTIDLFKTKWGWMLTDKKAASWWLNTSSPKIKLQGLYDDEWFAGLGVTQYKTSNGKPWYQTYMVKPKIPTECESFNDIAAVKLTSKYNSGNITSDFTIQNNDPDKDDVTTPKNVPWSITWSFTGTDSKGIKQTKSGNITDAKSYFPVSLLYKKNKVESYTIKNTGIKASWSGTVTLTATWNSSCGWFEETNCKNNSATTTIPVYPAGTDGKTCDPPEIKYEQKYVYELDLETTEVQAYTAEQGEIGKVVTTYKRTDFTKKREPWLVELRAKADAAAKDRKEKTKILEKATEKFSADEALYNKAPSTIESCSGEGKDKKCIDIPNPEKSRLAAVLEMDEIAYNKAYCDFLIAQDIDIKASTELWWLEDPIRINKTIKTRGMVYYDETLLLWAEVSLQEGESKTFTDEATLVEDGNISSEINSIYTNWQGLESRDYPEESTFENNRLDTPIYASSHEQACGPPGEEVTLEGIVKTTTNKEGTKEDLEVLKGKVINQSATKIKAGYGFSFENQVEYNNSIATEQVKGVTAMDSRFDTLSNYLEYEVVDGLYKVPNELKNETKPNIKTATSTWHLPTMYVEEYSGNLFNSNYASNVNRNRNDKILDGGRKWYVDFDETDRTYPFVSYTNETGINRFSVCLMGEVEVKGAILKNEVTDENDNSSEGEAEFVLRTIQPDNAFPGGTGWNWSGKTSTISSLTPWWNTTSTTYPKGITLTPNQVKAIRNYNKTNPLKDIKPNNNFSSMVSQ